MESMLIRNGRIVTATDDYRADILVEDGRVRMIGRDIPVGGDVGVHDAGGLLVLPGGVDVHTHLDWDFGAAEGGRPGSSSEREPGRPPSAAPPRSWTSPTRPVGRVCARDSTTGTAGRRARAWTSPPT